MIIGNHTSSEEKPRFTLTIPANHTSSDASNRWYVARIFHNQRIVRLDVHKEFMN